MANKTDDHGGAASAPPAGEWCYDIALAPPDDTRILGLWHFAHPERDIVRIVWRSKRPTSDMIYLTHEGGDFPHFMQTPHAWAPIPKIKRPRR